MKNTIKKVIKDIDSGTYFDSHFIIDQVIRDFSDNYLKFAAAHQARSKVTEYVHSEIAKLISSLDGTLVSRVPGNSISYNIRGKKSKCALWKKV
jgi:hypothetical protein